MKGRTVAFLTALLIIFCAVLSSCREPSGNVLPVITANHAEPETTDEPFAIVTDAPTEEPQFEKPVSFSDINFENAVREAIGRQIGSIYPSDLAGITVFSARVRGIVRIDEIVYFSSLEELDLMGNKIIDLSPLSTLTNLKTLNISKNFSVLMGNREKGLDISPLGSLVNLRRLEAGSNLITDASVLSKLTELRYLDLQNNRVSDLSPLAGCVKLEYLNIYGGYGIDSDGNETGVENLDFASGMTELETLYAGNNRIKNISGIARLPNLKTVDLSVNLITVLPDMSAMTSLDTLSVRYNAIVQIMGLIRQPSLRVLDIRDNYIRSVVVIMTIPKLETIYADGNPIQNTLPLVMFNSLRESRPAETPAPTETPSPAFPDPDSTELIENMTPSMPEDLPFPVDTPLPEITGGPYPVTTATPSEET